jgi:SAM-dependent methyltransferase
MINCLLCKSEKVSKEFSFPMSITSFSQPVDVPIIVYLCENCGHVFNPPSQLPDNFYEEEYELLLEDQVSEFVVFKGAAQFPLFDSVLNFIFENITPPSLNIPLRVLEVGAGKGMLLKRLKEVVKCPVDLFAIEPNNKSEPFLARNLKGHSISMTRLEDSPFKDKTFNLIISHGVLEHVPDPVAFLESIYNCMDLDTVLYIGVPNFEANPSDLVTTDHLSKFTTKTLEYLFRKLGFKILASRANKHEVFMTYLLQKKGGMAKNQERENAHADGASSHDVLNNSIVYVQNAFKAFEDAISDSSLNNKSFSIYGAGNIGLLALKYFRIDSNQVKCIYDDNHTFWGASRVGIPIQVPKELRNDPDSVVYIEE